MVGDHRRQARHQGLGEIVAHALDHQQFRTGDVLRRIAAGGERYQRIVGAVDHQGRRHDGAQLPAPVAGGDAGQQLARHTGRIVFAGTGACRISSSTSFAVPVLQFPARALPVQAWLAPAKLLAAGCCPPAMEALQRWIPPSTDTLKILTITAMIPNNPD